MAQENKKETEGWKKIESEIFKFEKEGDMIEGHLIDVDDSTMYDNKVYKIKKNDKTYTIFGTAVLDTQMRNVPIGSLIRVVYVGLKENPKAGQNDIKLFDVFVKE